MIKEINIGNVYGKYSIMLGLVVNLSSIALQLKENSQLSLINYVFLSVCWSGIHVPIAYSLLGGGVPIPEQRLCLTLDSAPIIFKNHYVLYLL